MASAQPDDEHVMVDVPPPALRGLPRRVLNVVYESRSAFVVLNVTYFVLVIGMLIFTALNPYPQRWFQAMTGLSFDQGGGASIIVLYSGGNPMIAIIGVFLVNLLGGSLLVINGSSLVLPFSGILIAIGRAILWGIIFAPNPEITGFSPTYTVLTYILMLLEGEATVLAMLGSFEQGRGLLWPASVGASTHWQGFIVGLKRMGLLYVLIAAILFVAATYEVFVIFVAAPVL